MKIVLFSHGFGVRKDDRGLFTNIAAGLRDVESIMFDYNDVDEASRTLIATTLNEQAAKLRAAYKEARADDPTAIIDLVCHSQGCVIAAMAELAGIRKTIFLAPPDDNFGRNIEQKIEQMKQRSGTETADSGTMRYPRRDGSTTTIPAAYWAGRKGVQPVGLYKKLAASTELIIVQARRDEVIGATDFSALPADVKIIQMDTGHNFEDSARGGVTTIINEKLGLGRETL